jgi:hypothetical protein
MGRVKEYYHDEICAMEPDQEPDAEQFYRDREVEMAKEVLRKTAARGQVKEGGQ